MLTSIRTRPTLIALTALLSLVVAAQAAAVETDWLDRSTISPDSLLSVVVFLDDDADKREISRISATATLTRAGRIREVTTRLRGRESSAMDAVERFLVSHSSTVPERFWITSALTATLTLAAIDELAVLDGVQMISPNLSIEGYAPVTTKQAGPDAASSSAHLAMLGVPAVWSRGITGAGRIVASFDTGIDGQHAALSPKWRGNHTSVHTAWFSTITPNNSPSDRTGHGTHTMGVMVGSDGSDTVGVAPGAEWIAAGVIDQGKALNATISDIMLAFQWALNPDGDFETTDDVPDVILNSWGIPAGLFGPCDDRFWSVIDNVEAAGIVTIFASGNEGPEPMSIRNPADRASSPINAFAVGAVDAAGIIAPFSSRGPAACDPSNIKPEVVAPGVNIRSAKKGGGYTLMSGTSMAAPYVAGLIALCREYSPDATVEEIKWALINSTADLGPSGEDNAYGYGLVNAERMLDYLPGPQQAWFSVDSYQVLQEETTLPGDTVSLRVILGNNGATVTQVQGHLTCAADSGIIILSDSTNFNFGTGSTSAMSIDPFRILISESYVHGQTADFTLELTDSAGTDYASLTFDLVVGYEPVGTTADHNSPQIEFTISDFGQYGLAPGSAYNLDGRGFRFDGSDNLLWEAGLIVGRSETEMVSSVRGSDGRTTPTDFLPEEFLSDSWVDPDQATHYFAQFGSNQVDSPLPIVIRQHTIHSSQLNRDGFVLMKYTLINPNSAPLTGMNFGFLADFDLIGGNEQVAIDEATSLVYQRSSTGPMVGLVSIENVANFASFVNAGTKRGFTDTELFALMTDGGEIDPTVSGDLGWLVSTGLFNLAAYDSLDVVFALVAGNTLYDLTDQAIEARLMYTQPTGLYDEPNLIPDGFALSQNYPNPFNPTTKIVFSLTRTGEVHLDIFNLLGRLVTTLISEVRSAGSHSVEWDATDANGQALASGVYFYRLQTAGQSQSRKMMLLR